MNEELIAAAMEAAHTACPKCGRLYAPPERLPGAESLQRGHVPGGKYCEPLPKRKPPRPYEPTPAPDSRPLTPEELEEKADRVRQKLRAERVR